MKTAFNDDLAQKDRTPSQVPGQYPNVGSAANPTFSTVFVRMAWKDYRVQREPWFACLAIALTIQLTGWFFTVGGDARATYLILIPMILSILFPICCGAILFAGEREERTSDWLLALSAPPAPVICAKLVIAIAGTLALQWVLVIVSLILWAANPPLSPNSMPTIFMATLPIGLIPLIWSTLASLLTRRVVVAIPIAAFLFGISFAFFIAVFVTSVSSGSEMWFLRLFAVFLGMNVAAIVGLGWRWCRGKYLDGSNLLAIAKSLPDRLRSWTGVSGTASRIPSGIEYDQSWRRTWQRLVWQERHRENLHLFLLAGSCLWTVAFFTLSVSGSPVHSFFPYILPIAMGILGFQNDTASSEPRFLRNAGISPATLWLARQAVWLPRALWITGIAAILSLCCEWSVHPSLKSLAFVRSGPDVELPGIFQLAPWFSTTVGYILLCYGCGQLAALLYKKIIPAIAIGMLLNIFVGWWIMAIVVLDLPRWWSLGFPAVTTLAITFWQMRYWMAEDRSWRCFVKLVAVMIAAPLAMVGMVAVHRGSEVFCSGVMYLRPQFTAPLDQAIASITQKPPDSDAMNLFHSELGRLSQKGLISPIPDSWMDDAQEIVRTMNKPIVTLNRPTRTGIDEFSMVHFQGLNALLSHASGQHASEGRTDDAIICCLANLKLARVFAAHAGIGHWTFASKKQGELLQFLETMKRTKKQGELLHFLEAMKRTPQHAAHDWRESLEMIENEVQQFPKLAEAAAVQYLDDQRTFVTSSNAEFFRAVENRNPNNPDPFLMSGFATLPWERTRYAHLSRIEAAINYQECLTLDKPELRTPGMVVETINDFNVARAAIEPLHRTTYDPMRGQMPGITYTPQGDRLPYWHYHQERSKEVLIPLAKLKATIESAAIKE